MLHNTVLMAAILSWILAQAIKTVLTLIVKKKFDAERILGSGGMPSSHSAMVCSLMLGMAIKTGVSSPFFAVTFAFAAVVMYDAMGVRRAAGEQARVLNRMLDKWEKQDPELSPKEDIARKELKEYLGHTPLEVLAGAMLGILVALVLV
ncbi:MAG TPA: acid phosphatase [Ruminococcaceae bacterium]|nr:acid phosphatase [Oscillospiraceae bacterium]